MDNREHQGTEENKVLQVRTDNQEQLDLEVNQDLLDQTVSQHYHLRIVPRLT